MVHLDVDQHDFLPPFRSLRWAIHLLLLQVLEHEKSSLPTRKIPFPLSVILPGRTWRRK